MRFVLAATLPAFFAVILCGQTADTPSKLDGTWQTENTSSKDVETWVIREKANSIHIAQSRGGEKLADFDCSSMGRECEVKESGKQARVSLWFNGPTLVELETRGSDIVKRRFTPAANGDALQVETVPVAPAGKPETIRLKRVQTSTAAS